MFRHVVTFRWKPEAGPAAAAELSAALAELPALIPVLRDYRFGPDAGLSESNDHFAVVADFDSAEDYLVYRDDPAHRAVIDRLILPNVESRHSVQLDIG
jgi:hypothetical protein